MRKASLIADVVRFNRTRRAFGRLVFIAVFCAGLARTGRGAEPAATSSIPKGERVMICGHSFHVFVGAPLAKIAAAAGITDHKNAGTQSIGGSTVTQHWNLPDDKNKVKAALNAGELDVLTLAPHMKLVPDKAIEDFTDLALAHNPNIRILVQESWMVFDNIKAPIKSNADRDQKTVDDLKPPLDDFKNGLEKQAREINSKHPKPVEFVVPVGDAVLALRAKVIAGEVPGFAKQSELFNDPIGHVKEPVQRLEAYCYFAAIYHRSPVGLTVFEKEGDADSHKLNQMLEEIAWKAVIADPMSGVSPASTP
jgi:hypothetical protein